MRALQTARADMESITSELRLRRALSARLPAASTTNLKIEQEVLVYREAFQPIKWTGTHKIVIIDDKQVLIDRNGETIQHSIVQVKPFHHDKLMKNLHSCLEPILPGGSELYDVQITEVLGPSDDRPNLPAFSEAKRKELAGLVSRGTWKIVRREEVSRDAHILTGRFVLAQGHKDPENHFWYILLRIFDSIAPRSSLQSLLFSYIKYGAQMFVKHTYNLHKSSCAKYT